MISISGSKSVNTREANMESVENLVRDVLIAALKTYPHDRAVRETVAWLVGHSIEFDIFAMPLVKRHFKNLKQCRTLKPGRSGDGALVNTDPERPGQYSC